MAHDSSEPDFQRLNEVLGGLSEAAVLPTDGRSLAQYLRDEGVGEDMVELAKASCPPALRPCRTRCQPPPPDARARTPQASYSNTVGAGAALDALPLAATAALERLWMADGDGDYRLLGPLSQLTAALVEGVSGWTKEKSAPQPLGFWRF